jgi:hypothetical protein
VLGGRKHARQNESWIKLHYCTPKNWRKNMKTHHIVEWIVKTPALIAGLMTVFLSLSVQQASAENFLDKLNKKLEQANSKIQKSAPNQPASGKNQMPADRQSKSGTPDSGQAVVSSAMRDVDIVGLKIGMTVAEARAALKARKLSGHDEKTGQLTYVLNGQLQSVPSGAFFSNALIYSYSTNPLPVTEIIWVSFTPEPGKERVAFINREVRFSQKEKTVLSEEEFIKSLIKKYGAPAVRREFSNGLLALAWGASEPRNSDISYCVEDSSRYAVPVLIPGPVTTKVEITHNWALNQEPEFSSRRTRECGHTYLYVGLMFVDPSARPGQRLLSSYTARLMSPALALSSYQTVAKLTEAARVAEEQRQLKRAKSEKAPDL